MPVFGVILFAAVSYHSYETERISRKHASKYFYWSLIRLDSDPANKRDRFVRPCEAGKENCVSWDLTIADTWVDPSLLDKTLMVSALPAFLVGMFLVTVFGRLGISQVASFMVLMPVLICAWYYLIGWLLDRWVSRRSHSSTSGS